MCTSDFRWVTSNFSVFVRFSWDILILKIICFVKVRVAECFLCFTWQPSLGALRGEGSLAQEWLEHVYTRSCVLLVCYLTGCDSGLGVSLLSIPQRDMSPGTASQAEGGGGIIPVGPTVLQLPSCACFLTLRGR